MKSNLESFDFTQDRSRILRLCLSTLLKAGSGQVSSLVGRFTFLFILAFIFLLPFSTQATASETIRSIQIENELPKRRPDILDVIRIKEGDEFSQDRLANAIEDLRKWGVFKNVEVLVKHEGNNVTLIFQLEDAFIIKDIKLRGNYPLLEKRVHRAIFLTTGDIYNQEKLPEQIARLIEFYEKEGYKNTTVFIETQKNLEERTVTLKIKIQKGKEFGIGEITIQGNTLFMDSRLRNEIRHLLGGYKPARFKKDLEAIKQLYRKHGYPRAKVKATEIDFNEKTHKVDITLEIHEGKKVEIQFTGNDHQFADQLRKVVSVEETGDYDEFELEHSRQQLISHYRSLGYEETQVSFETKEVDKNHVLVLFHIIEGPKRVIKSIDFEGNKAFSDKKLKKLMLTKEHSIGERGAFIEELFKQDLETIESFYQKNGFIEAKVEDWKRSLIETQDKYRIEIDLKEGIQTLVDQLTFEGLKRFKPEELKKFLLVKEGAPYSMSRLEEDVRALLIYYSNHGYPYAEAKTDVEETAPHKVAIRYHLIEGPEVRIGKILLVGNFLTKKSAIYEALRFKEGGLFDPKKILQSQTNLRKLGILDALSIETLGLKGKEKIVHIVIRMEEKKNRIIDLGFSYDTDTSFKVKLTYSRLNLWGRAKHLDLKLTAGFELNRGELAYVDPRFFGSDWQFLIDPFIQFEKRTFFEDFQAGGSAALLRDLSRRLSLLIRYTFTRTDFVESKTDFSLFTPEDNITTGNADNTTGKLQFSLTYDKRDNFGDPRSGIYAIGLVNFVTLFQGGVSHFFKLGERFGYWWSPFHRFTVANALRIDSIISLPNAVIPIQELIFLGGDDTVRGFKEDALNPSGGKLGIVHNLELQMRLIKGFEAVGFLDTGSLTNSVGEISLGSIRNSVGFGIRYITPVGPIRLDYGIILDPQPGDNFGRLHFTFGYFF
jgi:outer membrane protein insertion porin family